MQRILIVDDERLTQRLLVRLLEDAGYHCTVAEDGDEALSRLTQFDFDLVLSDVDMPGR